MEFDRKPALIIAVIVLVSNVDHIEPEGWGVGKLVLAKVGGHCLFEAVFYLRFRQLSLTTDG
jgi:hypothetical protein